MHRRSLSLLLPFLALACSESETTTLDGGTVVDAAPADSGERDAGEPDTGPEVTVDAGTMDASAGACEDPDCASCAADGECCVFSINCQPGSICNRPGDQYYDPTAPQDVCVRILCTSDEECDQGEFCSLEGLCRDAVCWSDSECAAGQACSGGRCAPRPDASAAASCALVPQRYVLTPGLEVQLDAVVRNSVGQPLLLDVDAVSSSDEVAAVNGRTIVAADAGTAQITASQGGLTCTGAVEVFVLGDLPPAAARVTAVWSDDGAPVGGATVTIDVSGETSAHLTNSNGVATFSSQGSIAAVTVEADPVFVTVVQPGALDIVVQMPRPRWSEAGGVRGVVDTTAVPRADVHFGLVGAAQPADLLDFGRLPLVGGDRFETYIDAPEVGIEDFVEMPGGQLLGLGTRTFTEDAQRCGDILVGPDQQGCYLFTMPRGARAAWTLTGKLRLSQVTSVANELSNAMSGEDTGASLTLTSRLGRSLYHGADPFVSPAQHPRVPVDGSSDCTDPLLQNYLETCKPDYESYLSHELSASHRLGLLSIVDMPNLPPVSSNSCAGYASVTAVADLGPRGLVPLGVIGAADRLDDNETPDCRVAGEAEPFGAISDPVADGQLALAMAPRHAGLEGYPVRLVAAAVPVGTDANTTRSVLVQTIERLDAQTAFGTSFPVPPTATLSGGVATLQLEPAADFVRVELFHGRRRWVVHAPATPTLTLPQVAATTAILQNMDAAGVLSVRGSRFGETWRANAEARLHPNDVVEGYAARRITP